MTTDDDEDEDDEPHRIALCRPVYDSIEFDAGESVIEFADCWRTATPKDQHWFIPGNAARGQPVDAVRNIIAKRAIIDCKADVLVWQDSDVGLPNVLGYGNLVTSLLSMTSDVGILGVPVIKQEATGAPIVNFSMKDMPHKPNPAAPFEVAAIGFGLVAVRADVYMAMSHPWHRFEHDATGNLASGEDIGFCDRARTLGWSVWVEPRIDARHNFRRSHSLRDMNADQWNALTR